MHGYKILQALMLEMNATLSKVLLEQGQASANPKTDQWWQLKIGNNAVGKGKPR